MVDLDSTRPSDEIGRSASSSWTRGAMTTFSIANDVAKDLRSIPPAFASTRIRFWGAQRDGLSDAGSAILVGGKLQRADNPRLDPGLELKASSTDGRAQPRSSVATLGLTGWRSCCCPLGNQVIE